MEMERVSIAETIQVESIQNAERRDIRNTDNIRVVQDIVELRGRKDRRAHTGRGRTNRPSYLAAKDHTGETI